MLGFVQSHQPLTPSSQLTSCIPFPTSQPVSSSTSPVLRKRALTPPGTPVNSSLIITSTTFPDINTRPTKTQRLENNTRNTMGHPTALRRSESTIFEFDDLSDSRPVISYSPSQTRLGRTKPLPISLSKDSNDTTPYQRSTQSTKEQQQQQLRRKERERKQKERERGRARNRAYDDHEEVPPVPPLPSGLASTSKSKVWMPSVSGSSTSNFLTASTSARPLRRQSAMVIDASSATTNVFNRHLKTSQLRPASLTPSPSSDSLASFFSTSQLATHSSTVTSHKPSLTSLPIRTVRSTRTRAPIAPSKVIFPSAARPYTTVVVSRPRSPLVPEEYRHKPQANFVSSCPAWNPNSKLSRPPQSGKRSKPDIDYYRTAIKACLQATPEGQKLLRMGPRLAMAIMNATQDLEKMVGEGGWDLGDVDGEDYLDMDVDADGEDDPDAEGEDDIDMLDKMSVKPEAKTVSTTITSTTLIPSKAKTTTWTPTPIHTSIAMAMAMSVSMPPLSKSPPKTSLAMPVMTASWVVVKGEDWEMVECAA